MYQRNKRDRGFMRGASYTSSSYEASVAPQFDPGHDYVSSMNP
jgi:hypothetical protein